MTHQVQDNWYEDFFKGLNCELWEKAVPEEWTKQEVDFLTQELGVLPGQALLDIPCGFGRHSVELAKRGFRMTGVDISETFITGLKKKTETENLSITTILHDVLTLELNQKFDGALCLGNSFGYFSFEKMVTFVGKISACLKPGARLVINSGMVAESILANFPKSKSYTFGDIKMDIENTYEVNQSFMVSHLTYTKAEHMERHTFKHYVFTMAEIHRLLQQCGLHVIGNYNSPSRSPYQFGDPQVYIVAEKS